MPGSASEQLKRIDIGDDLRPLLEKLGVDYEAVKTATVRFWPGEVTITQYERNEHGDFFIDIEKGELKMTYRTIPVTT